MRETLVEPGVHGIVTCECRCFDRSSCPPFRMEAATGLTVRHAGQARNRIGVEGLANRRRLRRGQNSGIELALPDPVIGAGSDIGDLKYEFPGELALDRKVIKVSGRALSG